MGCTSERKLIPSELSPPNSCRLCTILSSYKRWQTMHNNYCYGGKQMSPALFQTRFLLVFPALNDIIKLISLLWSSHFSILTQNTDSFLGYMFCLLSTQHIFDILEKQNVNRHLLTYNLCAWLLEGSVDARC